MRRIIQAVLVGSLAFGLVAAAASGASLGLTLQDVIRIGTFDETAEVSVAWNQCEGFYAIEWEIEGESIVGFSATRTTEDDPDDTLEFCANQVYRLVVNEFVPADPDDGQEFDAWGGAVYVPTVDDQTDEDGNIEATFEEPFDLRDRDEVTLLIGPEAATYFTY